MQSIFSGTKTIGLYTKKFEKYAEYIGNAQTI